MWGKKRQSQIAGRSQGSAAKPDRVVDLCSNSSKWDVAGGCNTSLRSATWRRAAERQRTEEDEET